MIGVILRSKPADKSASAYHFNHCHVERDKSLAHPEPTQWPLISTKSYYKVFRCHRHNHRVMTEGYLRERSLFTAGGGAVQI